mgnify:CR=1 FL=1
MKKLIVLTYGVINYNLGSMGLVALIDPPRQEAPQAVADRLII